MRNTARQTRENRTITVDFRSEATYFQWRGNGQAFLEVLRYRQRRPAVACDALLAPHGGLSVARCAILCHLSPLARYRWWSRHPSPHQRYL
jgi:hypothetical protein